MGPDVAVTDEMIWRCDRLPTRDHLPLPISRVDESAVRRVAGTYTKSNGTRSRQVQLALTTMVALVEVTCTRRRGLTTSRSIWNARFQMISLLDKEMRMKRSGDRRSLPLLRALR